MPSPKYEDYSELIFDLDSQGRKATEIANILNLDPNVNIEADESGIRSYIKRSQTRKDESIKLPPDPSEEKIKHLSSMLEEIERKNSYLQKEAVAQGKLLNNLENVKDEYEEIINRYSILNDTLQETIIITKEDVSRKKLYYMIAAGWILTIFLALLAGYYIGRCYAKTAFHYLLTLTALPAGIFIGMAINYGKNKQNKPDTSNAYRRACELASKKQ
jgi:hypothetical protein